MQGIAGWAIVAFIVAALMTMGVEGWEQEQFAGEPPGHVQGVTP